MASFTRSITVIGANGKRYKLTDNYHLNGKEAAKVDSPVKKATDFNQWVRRAGIEILP